MLNFGPKFVLPGTASMNSTIDPLSIMAFQQHLDLTIFHTSIGNTDDMSEISAWVPSKWRLLVYMESMQIMLHMMSALN